MLSADLTPDVLQRALRARDPRFDGVFFVAITTTRVYCRPVCPARVTHPDRRRFFATAAAAERAGFRPCMRCRPELAPGRALCDAVSRLAAAAAHRIAAGDLNGRSVAALASDLCVSERHLRRALERELGVSPLQLAQTHRLLLAKRLLADTDLSISRIAYASGFQSLRRFNSVFRERYRMPPNALRTRRATRPQRADQERDLMRLTLAYRPPLAWDALLAVLAAEAVGGTEVVERGRYACTVQLAGCSGIVFAEDAAAHGNFLNVTISATLVPVLMPLLAKLRQLFDLDAEPTVIDTHLAHSGLADLVSELPGVRMPGALDGFGVAWRVLLDDGGKPALRDTQLAGRIVAELGEPADTGVVGLTRFAPAADRLAAAGVNGLEGLGVARERADAIVSLARHVADGLLRLDPGADVAATTTALRDTVAVSDDAIATIVMRALHWPDAFPAGNPELQRAAGAPSERALVARSERWRPWRAYAAARLWHAAR
jgi:AraC family transcriptional regulator, regulatory protein of adaptative response / DNA-3-methyladenine glycosylase II